MRKASFELKIALIMLVAVIIVSATGFLAYDRLTSIADSLLKEARPDLKLVILKGILSDLADAESHIKSYSITRDDQHLEPYYYTISEIDDKIDELNALSYHASQERSAEIDSIGILIEEKFRIWDEMLQVSQNDPLKKVFTQIKQKIEYKEQKAALEKRLDALERQRNKENEVREEPEEEPEEDEVAVQEEPEKKKSNIFKRLFGRRMEAEQGGSNDTTEQAIVHTTPARSRSRQPGRKDSATNGDSAVVAAANADSVKVLPKEEIKQEIAMIEKKEDNLRLKKTARQLQIIEEDKVITDKIRTLISKLEAREMKKIEQRAMIIDKQADKTNQLIALFCITTSLLLFFIFSLIVRYVRSNQAYQRALRTAKMQAENLAATKEAFMANMSHEIRTPMNSIVGFTEQALKSPNPDDQKEYLNVVRNSSQHLLKIINDILDFSKLEASKLTIERISFQPAAVFHDIFRMMALQAEQKRLEFHHYLDPAVPETLVGDPMRLKQITFNLIGNAIKFTERGSVTVRVIPGEIKGSVYRLRIEVQDTGIGISPDRIDNIFEEFVQAEMSTTRKYGGTGLGLAITKRLIDLQGGTIEVRSEAGLGSVFTFTIPYELTSGGRLTEPVAANGLEKTGMKGLKALIVDDEQYNRLLLTTILKGWGAEYDEAEDGKMAIDMLEKKDYDVVLMDVRMPVMDGLQATKHIRKKMGREVPVIALTAATSGEDMRRCREAGMNDFLSKPFTEDTLYEKLTDVLRSNGKAKPVEPVRKAPGTGNTTGFNINNLQQLANGDESFIREMLQMFIETTREGIEAIREAQEEKNWDAVADQAHKIMAPCRHLEAMQLLAYLKEIEQKARTKKALTRLPSLIGKMEREAQGVMKEIKRTFLSEVS